MVDDEVPLARLVAGYLEREGFEVRLCHDGAAALPLLREVDPDLVVLDLGLPGLDGLDVCRRLREFSDCYVLVLTARAEEADTLVGLAAGADDYVTKPFSPRELVARAQVLMRRPRRPVPAPDAPRPPRPPLVVGALVLDPEAREVRLDGVEVPLTRTEFDVLHALAARPGTALTRRELVDAVWGPGWVGDVHLVDVHVLHLRQKLGDTAERQRVVRTVRGVGYRIGEGR
ncbi:response regulator transcription factor [Cellulomonas marina]|uniref:DNA-binding response regulator, OmpR family, contains REC and winged-helix (WHTH) domain n=1 Tax=Cellulomonas marina TaxID=988821 RepID=A0A1I0YFC0_9CELL|nr:response regulator transcription factor [Cellulomonas marina]SFB11882.1 DNA-binding response regulator, OmpR family, contains REC and winged-helix (wHTH) domain [Cellulomonas marina]